MQKIGAGKLKNKKIKVLEIKDKKVKVLEFKLLECKVSIQLNKNKTSPQLMIPHDVS